MSQPQEQVESTQATDLLSALTNQLMALQPGGHIYSASIKLPEFWTTSPKVWFARLEAQFGTKNITQDQTQYDYVVSAVDVKTAEEVQDVLVRPPNADKYATLKKALIKAFGKSQAQRDSELLNLNGLGDRKPTALLRKINALNDDPQEGVVPFKPSRRPFGKRQCQPLGVAVAGTSHQPNTLSVVDRTSGLSYLVDTGAEVSVYPAFAQDRRAQQPTSTLTATNGTSIHTWGRRSVSLAIGRRRQYNHEFYLADVTRPILGADFFTKHGLAIDLRGKRLLSLNNISILLAETKSPLALAGLGFPLQNKYSSLLQQFPELLTPHFHHSTNKHGVEHHIVTHGWTSNSRSSSSPESRKTCCRQKRVVTDGGNGYSASFKVSLVFTPSYRP
ncbi:transposon Tf2-9 polyprotein [Elysia marginata]|uniref:Transposon Tf2-9 polyprotein n=1 Tax=Elysia marginata TaxID=1093978 RepID=A0AAV4IUL2_9GAST|nr:transposon Tf2-9 polyprotein [Elysia marginata]